jgi:hypothetical protein
VDGALALYNDKVKEIEASSNITLDVVSIVNKLFVRATVTTEKGSITSVRQGIAEVEIKANDDDPNASATFDYGHSLEIAASSAIRKAILYEGHGRFATHTTAYGENPLIEEFRKFKTDQNKDE